MFMSRVAIVTGGTRGIGAAISKLLHQNGYKVAANYAGNVEKAKAFEAETGIKTYQWNVADFAACQEGVKKVERDLGPVDVVVNNAGITRDTTLHKMTHEQWQAVIDTNLGGCFNMCRAVIDGMRERGFGRIVNIGSINGQAGQYGQVNYAAAKSGIHGFTKALAQEGAARGITVNAIAPGYIDTDMAGEDRRQDSGRPPGPRRGNRPWRAVPGRGRGRVHHWLDAQHQWRPAYVLGQPEIQGLRRHARQGMAFFIWWRR
jgi:acetoacetyl-CoA reductase